MTVCRVWSAERSGLVEGDVGEAAVEAVGTDDGLGGAAEEAADVSVFGPDAVFVEVDGQGARGSDPIGEGVGGGAVVAGDLLGADVDALSDSVPTAALP